jgi:hypothetical protein
MSDVKAEIATRVAADKAREQLVFSHLKSVMTIVDDLNREERIRVFRTLAEFYQITL